MNFYIFLKYIHDALEELRSSTHMLSLVAIRIRDACILLSNRINTPAAAVAATEIEASAVGASSAVTALLTAILQDTELD